MITIGKNKTKKFRIYIQERSLGDRKSTTSNTVTLLDFEGKYTAKKIKEIIVKSFKVHRKA